MSTTRRVPFQHGFCPRCGRNRWHWLANPCHHREAPARTRDWSGLVGCLLIAAMVAWVAVKWPW